MEYSESGFGSKALLLPRDLDVTFQLRFGVKSAGYLIASRQEKIQR
jgi:hypothetical protein